MHRFDGSGDWAYPAHRPPNVDPEPRNTDIQLPLNWVIPPLNFGPQPQDEESQPTAMDPASQGLNPPCADRYPLLPVVNPPPADSDPPLQNLDPTLQALDPVPEEWNLPSENLNPPQASLNPPVEEAKDSGYSSEEEDLNALTIWEGYDSFYNDEIREECGIIYEHENDESWVDAPIVQPVDLLLQDLDNADELPVVDNAYAKLADEGYDSKYDYERANKYLLAIEDNDPFNEEEAEKKYLASKPTCFIIFGLPLNVGRNLAKRIAHYWGCIVIDAESVVNDELINEPYGEWGSWLGGILYSGEAISNETVFELVYSKMHSLAARHVGYVMVGVPILPTDRAHPDMPPSEQLNRVLGAEMYPDVIIHIMGDENDLFYTRSKLAYDTVTGVEIDFHMIDQCHQNLDRFTVHDDKRQQTYFDEWAEYEQERKKALETTGLPQCFITLPHNWPSVLRRDLDYYETFINYVVRRAILTHDQHYVIKLDGRAPSFRMLEIVKAKLDTLPLIRPFPVIWMSKQNEGGPDGPAEGAEEGTEKLPGIGEDKANPDKDDDPEQAFAKVLESQKAGDRFRWHLSLWGYNCPVTSTEFIDVPGKAELACRFMDKVYFLASEEACKTFINSPRPYVKLEEVYIPDRIFISGARRSGKTTLADYYAKTLGAKMFDMEAVDNELLDIMEPKRATFRTVLRLITTHSLIYKETGLHLLRNTLSVHRSRTRFLRHLSNIRKIRSVVRGVRRASSFSTRDLVLKVDWYLAFMNKEPVPRLQYFWANKPPYQALIDDVMTIMNDPKVSGFALHDFERAQALAVKIREYENEGIVDETGITVPSTKTWVVDNAPLKIGVFDFLQLEKTLPNRYIFLIDEVGDYDYMMSKFAENEHVLQLNHQRRADIVSAAQEIEKFEARGRQIREDREGAMAALEQARREAAEAASRESSEKELLVEEFTGGRTPFPAGSSEMNLKQRLLSERQESDYERISILEKEIRTSTLSSAELILTNRRMWSASAYLHSLSLPLKREYDESLVIINQEWSELTPLIYGRARIDSIVINGLTLSALLEFGKAHTNVVEELKVRKKTDDEIAMEKKKELEISKKHGNATGPLVTDNDIREMFFKKTCLSSFGDTFKCCPVVFKEGGYLVPGKEKLSYVYRDKTYWLANKSAEEQFIANPSKYVELKEAIDHLKVAPRICVVGPVGCGKTELAKKIANTLKINYYNFEELVEQAYMERLKYKIGRKYEEKNVIRLLGIPVDIFGHRRRSSGSGNASVSAKPVESAAPDEPEDLFTNNKTMYKALRDYLVLGKSIPHSVLDKVVRDTWFSEPAATEGFVLDGFPCRPSDIEYMEKRFIVPNLIIHLEGDASVVLNRIFRKYLDVWKARQDHLQELSYSDEDVPPEDMDREMARPSLDTEKTPPNLDPEISPPIPSLSDTPDDSDEKEDDKVEDTNDEVDEVEEYQLPEVFYPETEYRATTRILDNIKYWVEEDIKFCNSLKAYAMEENIPWKTFSSTLNQNILWVKGVYASHENNCVEKYQRIHEFSLVRYLERPEAQKLLKSGYFMLSKFGFWCPVQVSVQDSLFPAMSPVYELGPIPVIYRRNIYYLASPQNLLSFEKNPEKYIRETANLPLINIRIAVQGLPYSGKTELCKKLAAEFGLEVVSPGDAMRYVLMNLEWTDLAKELKKHLQQGLTATPYLISESISAYIKTEKGLVGGFVLDGYPNTTDEAYAMEFFGFTPIIMFVIVPDNVEYFNRIAAAETHTSYVGTEKFFSEEHMRCKMVHYLSTFPNVDNWFMKRYRNVYNIQGSLSRWKLFEDSKSYILYHYMRMYSYTQSYSDVPHILSTMCVTPQEFIRRSADTSHFCIMCWLFKYQLVTEGFPPPAYGVIQYKDKYYYVCQAHRCDFLIHPEDYINIKVDRKTPLLPTTTEISARDNVYAKGLCVVTFVNHKKPCRIMGKESLAVKYGEDVYLFANKKCQTQFMENPEFYSGRNIRFQEARQVAVNIPPIMPLGFLEQSVSRIVNDTVACFMEFRPFLGGVNLGMYTSIYAGFQLIVRNPEANPIIKRWAREQIKKYHEIHHLLKLVFENCRQLLQKTTKEYLT